MSQDTYLVAIDGGTTKVCVIIGQATLDGEVQVLGYGLARSRGFHKGTVSDLEQAQQAVQAAVQDAQLSSGIPISAAYVGVTGHMVASSLSQGETSLRSNRPVTPRDLLKVQAATDTSAVGHGDEVLHAIPLGYSIDGRPARDGLLGMHGLRLGMEAHIVSSPPGPLWNVRKAVTASGVHVEGLVVEAIASGESVLTEKEKEAGALVVDIGGGSTDIAIFYDGRPVFTAALPVGGYHITNDIAIGLTTPATTAEQLKVEVGAVYPIEGEPIQIPSFGHQRGRTVTLLELSLLIKDRATEMLRYVQKSLATSPRRYPLGAGVVLTGGSAHLPGLDRLVQDTLGLSTRIGYPIGLHKLPEELNDSAFATATGILLWAHREKHRAFSSHLNGSNGNGQSKLPQKVRGWLRSLFMAA